MIPCDVERLNPSQCPPSLIVIVSIKKSLGVDRSDGRRCCVPNCFDIVVRQYEFFHTIEVVILRLIDAIRKNVICHCLRIVVHCREVPQHCHRIGTIPPTRRIPYAGIIIIPLHQGRESGFRIASIAGDSNVCVNIPHRSSHRYPQKQRPERTEQHGQHCQDKIAIKSISLAWGPTDIRQVIETELVGQRRNT